MIEDDMGFDILEGFMEKAKPRGKKMIPTGEKKRAPCVYDYYKIVERPEDLVEIVGRSELKPDGTRTRLSAEQDVFLTHYMGCGVVTTALRKSGLTRKRYTQMMQDDALFIESVQGATEAIADTVEQEALKRALTGSDRVLIKMLEALKPKKFGKSSTVQNLIDGQLSVVVGSWAELSSRVAKEVEDVRIDQDTVRMVEGQSGTGDGDEH